MTKTTVEIDGHRLHLNALVMRERDVSYQRHGYLSADEWRTGLLWRKDREAPVKGADAPTTMTAMPPSRSQSSVEESPTTRRKRFGSHMSVMTSFPDSSISSPYYLVGSPESMSEKICIHWRAQVTEWMYHQVDMLDLSREIVSISTFYLDQYHAKTHIDDEKAFQVVAMTSLYLAIKLHSGKKVAICAIASTGNGAVPVRDIEAMELSIMRCLDWHLFPPTSVSIIENFYPIIVSNPRDDGRGLLDNSLEFSLFLAELSVCSYPCVSVHPPSSIAIAAILLGFEYFDIPDETRDAFRRSVDGLAISVDSNSPEVEACGGLLRRLYALAMPADTFFVGG